MAVIAILLLLQAGAIWWLRRWQDARSPMPPPQLTEPTTDVPEPTYRAAALTEDDVILFGLALEASDDVISDLLADSR